MPDLNQLKLLLHSYYQGNVSLDALLRQINAWLKSEPGLIGQIKLLQADLDDGSQIYKTLNTQLDQYLQDVNSETVMVGTEATRLQGSVTVMAQSVPSVEEAPAFDARRQRALAPGDILKERFVLEEILGTGGMSVVFKARDIRKEEANDANPHVAMKVLGHEFKEHPESFMVLQRETQKAQRLAHPNIVTVYDFDRDGDTIYMTMECMHGNPLDKIIKDNPAGLSLEEAVPIITGMSHALAYAHKKDIIHSDFKPGNVFVTDEGVAKVLDFGIARAKNVTTDFDAGALGALTPTYASCEMFNGDAPDPRDDIYALACMTYELLTGRHPFNRMPADKARDEKLEPKRIANLSPRRWMALRRGLAFSRDERTETVNEFLQGVFPAKASTTLRAALAAVLVMVLATGYFYQKAEQAPELPVVELTAEEKTKVADYLETAELYMELGQLATPPGDSAFDLYDLVLSIDPTNQPALEGKERIADHYHKLAAESYKKGDMAIAGDYVDTGLQVMPGHEGLLKVRGELR